MFEWTPKQQALIDDINGKEHDRIVVSGPVRSGKSVSAVYGFMTWLLDEPKGTEFIVSSTTAKQLKSSILNNMEMFCLEKGLTFKRHTPEHYKIDNRIILWPLMGPNRGDSEKAKSYSVKGAIIDETSDQDEEFVNAVEDRCSDPDAKVVLITNPKGPKHWLKKKWIDEAKHDKLMSAWKFALSDNPSLTSRYLERLHKRYTGVQYQRMVLGQWASTTNPVWPNIHDAIIPYDPTIEFVSYSVGIRDMASKRMHCVKVGVTENGTQIVCSELTYDHLANGGLSTNKRIELIKEWLSDEYISFIGVDPQSKPFINELRRWYYGTKPVDLESIAYAAKSLDIQLGKDLFIFDTCTELIDDVLVYQWSIQKTMIGLDIPQVSGDVQGCEALCYQTLSASNRDQISIVA